MEEDTETDLHHLKEEEDVVEEEKNQEVQDAQLVENQEQRDHGKE